MEADFVVDDDGGIAEATALKAAGQANATQHTLSGSTGSIPKPDRRQQNPLSDYSSYTYQIVLAMLTPEANTMFVNSGRKFLPQKGSMIIAQSGGINNTLNQRADGFKLDYYIDDLKIKAAIAPAATGAAITSTEMSFVITEPYGFSFPTNLKRAAIQMGKLSGVPGAPAITDATKQFFVIGIRFLGYDENGNLVRDSERVMDRYYDITITEMKFKIDGKTSTYAIKAAPQDMTAALSIKRGMINKGASINAATVGEIFTKLAEKLTADQIPNIPVENRDRNDRTAASKPPLNTYFIEFRGPGSDLIQNAKLASKADTDKSKSPMGVTISEVPDTTKRTVVFKDDTPILQAIQQVISQSSFLTDALKIITTTAAESNDPDVIPDTKKRINWYNVTVLTIPKAWNISLNDWEFDIKYIIQPYRTPFTLSTNANKTTPYYGPAKRYDYWYTGKNSEILKFEQSLNTTFFTVSLSEDTAAQTESNHTSTLFRKQSGNHQGAKNEGAEASLEYVTSLMDPGGWTPCKIDIMGDPDWLTYVGAPPIEPTDFSPFYGPDGFSINPTSSQVFIEVDFNEAVDYNNTDGLLSINDKILFWDYSPEIARVLKGISYLITECVSTFSKGQFRQTLSGNVNSTFIPDPGVVPAGPPNQRKPEDTKQAPKQAPPPISAATVEQITTIQQANDDALIGQGTSPFSVGA